MTVQKRRAIHLKRLIVIFAASFLLWPSDGSAESLDSDSFTPALDDIELQFLQLLNEYREANGLNCLVPSPTMNAAADYMSRAMGEQGFFSHQEPPCDSSGENCTGRDPFERISAFGHTGYSSAAENISGGAPSARGAFEGWKNSPGHNANMLGNTFRSIGIARVKVPNSLFGVYWTTNFSDRIDGGGDCFEEGPNDYPASGESGTGDDLANQSAGWCNGISPHPWCFLLLGWVLFRSRRRWASRFQ